MAGTLVPTTVLIQILLMILLGGPPPAGGRKLGDDAPLPPLLVDLPRHLPRHLLLLGVVEVDGGPVLRPRVGALGVERRRVVHLVEELEQLAVRDLFRVEDDLRGFGV